MSLANPRSLPAGGRQLRLRRWPAPGSERLQRHATNARNGRCLGSPNAIILTRRPPEWEVRVFIVQMGDSACFR